MRLSHEAARSMQTRPPSEASKAAQRRFAQVSDRFEDLRRKHKLLAGEASTPERIKALKLPEADKAELLRLDQQMAQLATEQPPL